MRRVGPSAPDRAAGIAVAVAVHAAVLLLAGISTAHAGRGVGPAPRPAWIPVRIVRLAHAVAGHAPSPAPRGGAPRAVPVPVTPVRVAERELIQHRNGLAMTIEGGADAGVPATGGSAGSPAIEQPSPPRTRPADERWLRMDVWVGAPPSAPHPSRYCAPARPVMPEDALEGRVEVVYEVDRDGVVRDIEFEGPAPHLLARSVRAWLRGCLFDPAVQDGRRTAARVRQAFVFRIR
ncbi:MAG: hypothetical protein ACM3PC_02365 [Deltaproteobacteria bacterium]